MAKLDAAFLARLRNRGDAFELHGEIDRFGGRPVIADIAFDGTAFAIGGWGIQGQAAATLLAAIAMLHPDHAARGDWEFLNG